MGRLGLERSRPVKLTDDEDDLEYDREDPVQDALAAVIRVLDRRPGPKRAKPKEEHDGGEGNQSPRKSERQGIS